MATHLDLHATAVNHHAAGRLAEAEALYRRTLAVEPSFAPALHLAGVAAAQTGRPAAGARLIRRCLRIAPETGAAFVHYGSALRLTNAMEGAEAVFRQALALLPADAEAADGLGGVLHVTARYGPSLRWLLRAHRVEPARVDTLINLGTVLRDSRRFADAEACLAAAIARRPDHAEAHRALAVTRLVQGDLERGFESFEWRWRRYAGPPWSGEPLGGSTILLHAEQGFGDTIQFARYAPAVSGRGGRVVLEVHPALVRLMRSLDPAVTVVASDAPVAPHDRHCPLLSLPRAFRTTLATVPAAVPYLAASPADEDRVVPRFAGTGGVRVGVVWAGNPRHANDRNRSLPVRMLEPLRRVPGVTLFSLQTGEARADAGAVGVDLMDGVADFADTAALLAHLDLVIAVDTGIVHLAGALGRPCWVLLPFAPDWRWLIDRPDTPWYPTLRLFRQPRPGDWATALATVAACLKAYAARQQATDGPAR